jgi:hypothetical protein
MEQDNTQKAVLIKLDDLERSRFASSIKDNLFIHDSAKKDGTASVKVLADRVLDDLNAILTARTYMGGRVPRRKPDDPGDYPDGAVRVNVDYPPVTERR